MSHIFTTLSVVPAAIQLPSGWNATVWTNLHNKKNTKINLSIHMQNCPCTESNRQTVKLTNKQTDALTQPAHEKCGCTPYWACPTLVLSCRRWQTLSVYCRERTEHSVPSYCDHSDNTEIFDDELSTPKPKIIQNVQYIHVHVAKWILKSEQFWVSKITFHSICVWFPTLYFSNLCSTLFLFYSPWWSCHQKQSVVTVHHWRTQHVWHWLCGPWTWLTLLYWIETKY